MKTLGIGISFFLFFIFSANQMKSQCIPCAKAQCGQLNVGFSPEGGVDFCEGALISLVNTSAPEFDYFVIDWSDGSIDTLNSYSNAIHSYYLPDSNLCNGDILITICFQGIKNCINGQSCTTGTYNFNLKVRPKAIITSQAQYCIQSPANLINSSCNADSYLWNFGDGDTSIISNPSHTYSSPGIFNVSLIAANECGIDIITNSILISDPLDPLISQDSNVLIALADQGNIQWVDCDNNYEFISDETNQVFSPLASGNYAYIYTENSCVDTSDCIQVDITGLRNIPKTIEVRYFPNPIKNEIFLESVSGSEFNYELISNTGLNVATSVLPLTETRIDMNGLVAGLYFLKIRQSGGVQAFKIIKL